MYARKGDVVAREALAQEDREKIPEMSCAALARELGRVDGNSKYLQ